MIRLIVFDLWQTLAYRDVGYSTTSKMLEKTGVEMPKEKFVKIFEESVQTRSWKSKNDAYQKLCKNMGLEVTSANVGLLRKIRDKAEEKTKLYPHTLSMIKKLKNQGFKIGLISNTTQFNIVKLREKTKLLNYIDYPLFSFETGTIKPNLKPFRKILEMSNCRPKETIMIGDKLVDDIIPAKKIGMNTILYKNYTHLKKEFSHLSIAIE